MTSSTAGRRAALALALLACSSLCWAFCPPGVASPGAKKGTASNAAPSGLSGVGQDITLTLPDPKFPSANKLLYYLRAGAIDGQLTPDGSYHGGLTKLWVRLYQKGAPSAVLIAPVANGGGTSKAFVLTGRGGVVVKSLAYPGTVLTADAVVWRSALSQVEAIGHVFYHNSLNGATYRGPYLKSDTKLGTFSTRSGHMAGTF